MRRALGLAAVLALIVAAPASATLPWRNMPVTAWEPAPAPVEAKSVAVSPQGSLLYVLDSLGRVLEYSTKTGAYVGGFTGGFDHASAIAADPYGSIWVADTGHGRVQKLTAGGKPLLSFSTPQPIGVAAGTAELYVLSGVLRAVGERTWKGADAGGYLATFPDGFSPAGYGLYGPPSGNSAVAIAADQAGHSVVAGTVTQPLVNGERPSCKSPVSTLPALPDPLVAPAVTVFHDNGAAIREVFPFDAGAPCWTDSFLRWSYGLTGRHGLGLAVDPVSGEIYSTTDEGSGPWWVVDETSAHLGIWDPRDGPTADVTGLSSSLYGPIRAFTIACDSTLYLVTDQRIERFGVPVPDRSRCHLRNAKLDAILTVQPVLGGVPLPGGKSTKSLPLGSVLCPGAHACRGTVLVTLAACGGCRRLTTIRRVMTVAAGGARTLSVSLPGELRRRLARGTGLVAAARVGKGAATTFPLRAAASLTATCGSGFSVSGVASPARAGLRVTVAVTGPAGALQTFAATTGAHGRWSVQAPAPAGSGAWTAFATLPVTKTLGAAQASCGMLVGGSPAPLAAAPPPGRQLSAVDLTLTCPAGGVAGQELALGGNVVPGDAGVAVALSAPGAPASATTAADGSFSVRATPPAGGDWTLTARATVAGADLVRTCVVPVAKAPSALTASCPSANVPFPGHRAGVDGALTPAIAGATVTVTFRQPGHADVADTAQTDASGAYAVDFMPPAPGDWTAAAAWPGDAAHAGASATTCVVRVG